MLESPKTYDLHLFNVGDTQLVLDAQQLIVAEIDETSAAILSSPRWDSTLQIFDQLKPNFGVRSIEKALHKLQELGLLWDEHFPPLLQQKINEPHYINSIVLNVSQTCNLRCDYCLSGYARGGHYGLKASLMPHEIAARATDLLLSQSGLCDDCTITFFGGEPLMNLDIIERTIEHANNEATRQSKRMHYRIITNGTLLSPSVNRFVAKVPFEEINISIDGTQAVHDRYRRYPNGKGSYDLIVRNFRDLKQVFSGITKASARFSYENVSNMAQSVEHLLSLGFDEIDFDLASSEYGEFLTDDSLETVLNQYMILIDWFNSALSGGELLGIPLFIGYLISFATRDRRTFSCYAGMNELHIMTDGTVYPCHKFASCGSDRALGNVMSKIDFEKGLSFLEPYAVEKRDTCKNCWARYLCGGECYAYEYQDHEAEQQKAYIPNPYRCAIKQRCLEQMMATYVKLGEEDPELLSLLPYWEMAFRARGGKADSSPRT